jgi:hypothetical protein
MNSSALSVIVRYRACPLRRVRRVKVSGEKGADAVLDGGLAGGEQVIVAAHALHVDGLIDADDLALDRLRDGGLELCAELYNRMPVVLKPETWAVWLGRSARMHPLSKLCWRRCRPMK